MILGTNTNAIPSSTKEPTKPKSSLPDETKSAGENGSVTPVNILFFPQYNYFFGFL
jgi:hypothetical protein